MEPIVLIILLIMLFGLGQYLSNLNNRSSENFYYPELVDGPQIPTYILEQRRFEESKMYQEKLIRLFEHKDYLLKKQKELESYKITRRRKIDYKVKVV